MKGSAKGLTLRRYGTFARIRWRNRGEAIERFVELIRKALKPKKKWIATKIPKAAREKRLEKKRLKSNKKNLRKATFSAD